MIYAPRYAKTVKKANLKALFKKLLLPERNDITESSLLLLVGARIFIKYLQDGLFYYFNVCTLGLKLWNVWELRPNSF